MIKKINLITLILSLIVFCSCNDQSQDNSQEITKVVRQAPNDRQVDRFADVQVLRYDIKDFDQLSLDQKKLVYYLSEAGLSGRDIIYDQNNAFNLEIRRCLEFIVANFMGDKETDDWYFFMTYIKQIWFANGIHHHYGMEKFTVELFLTKVTSPSSSIILTCNSPTAPETCACNLSN